MLVLIFIPWFKTINKVSHQYSMWEDLSPSVALFIFHFRKGWTPNTFLFYFWVSTGSITVFIMPKAGNIFSPLSFLEWTSWKKMELSIYPVGTLFSTCSHLYLHILVWISLMPQTRRGRDGCSPYPASKDISEALNYNTFQPHNSYQNKCIKALPGKDMNGFCEANWQQVYPDLFLIKILLWNVFKHQMQLVTKVQITDITEMQPRFRQASWRHFWTQIRLCCKYESLEHH